VEDEMKLKAIMLAVVCVLVGVLIGAMWPENVQAQGSRFRTERQGDQGELLFIRYLNSINGVQCFLGMGGTGIIEVPCDRSDHSSR
jgi:hypothetical protein